MNQPVYYWINGYIWSHDHFGSMGFNHRSFRKMDTFFIPFICYVFWEIERIEQVINLSILFEIIDGVKKIILSMNSMVNYRL